MPKDITSYFKPLSKTKEKAPPKIDLSDDDVIPESPDVQIKSKKKETKKKRGRVIDDSSDEEIFTKKKKSTVDDEKKSSHSSKDKKPDKKFKEVKPADLFGSGPIKRTEALVKKAKKEPKTEIGIHDDEDFEKSLLEIDNIEDLVNGECSKSKNDKSPVENTESITKNVKKVDATSTKPSTSTKETNDFKVNGINDNKKEKSPRKDEIRSNRKDKSPKKAETITSPKKEKENAIAKPAKLANYKIPKTPSAENKHKHYKKEEEKTVKNETSKSKTEDHNGSVSINSDKKDSASSSKNRKRENYVASKMDKKRDFSEFIGEDEPNHDDDEQESRNKSKKKKLDTSLNSSVLSDEERHERKRHSALLYQSYLNRSGPKNLGAKEIPEGAPNCLKDYAFLLTGVLDSFEREEITEAITKYGGCIKSGVTKKVTHVLAGNDAGPAKLAKAQDLGIRVISEDDFLQMIKDSTKTSKDVPKNKDVPSGSKERKGGKEERSDMKSKRDNSSESKSKPKSAEKPKVASEEKMKSFEDKIRKSFYSKTKDAPISIESSPEKDVKPKPNSSVSKTDVKSKPEETAEPSCSKESEMKREPSVTLPAPSSLMWVDKYQPQSVKQIIGQHGDASNAKKLINWLTKWYLNRREKIPKPSPWAKNDDGAYYKAVLLSGPPGVGKTTTVSLVCKEMGFDTVEFNASDTRSKSLIKEQIGELLTTTSLSGFARGDTGKKAVTKKHVLVMDEVDGMAGNEDRGGLQELISLIKTTSVPVICMCNDRNSEKMRSLVNYCYDLKFAKPRVDQIKSAMLSVCCKERIKISPDTLARLIASCNQDVRQTLNALSMWAVDPDSSKLSDDADSVRKDLKLGPWDAVRKVFSAEEHKRMSINDKSDLFFYDYSLAPLFVHENYLSVAPHCDKKQVLSRVAEAADSLSLGDTVEKRIRSSQAWSLLPLQAMYSSVIPGSVLSGHVAGQIQFPGWLGKNSRANKMNRLAQEIHAHTRLSTTGSKSSIYLDYSKHLRDAIITPLIKDKADGIPSSIQVLNDYHLLREDLDSLTELAMWPGQRDPMVLVDSKIKAAMTRAYNKQAPAQPHAAASFTRGKRREREGGDDGEADESERDSEPENDGMIKVKKTNAQKGNDKEDKPSTSKGKKGNDKEDKPSTSKGKKGKGKK